MSEYVFQEDGINVYRASSFGACPRALVAARLGAKPTEFSESVTRVMDEGNLHEENILGRLVTEFGFDRRGLAQEEVNLSFADIPGAVIRGHIDEIVHLDSDGEGEDFVVDAKAMSDNAYKRWVAGRWDERPGIRWQLSVYCAVYGLRGIIAAKNRNTGEIDLWIAEDLVSEAELGNKLARIESTDVPTVFSCEGQNTWFCPFIQLHDGYKPRDASEPGPKYLEASGDFERLLEAYSGARKQADFWSAKRSALRDAIVLMIGDETALETPGFRVTHTSRPRSWFSKKKLEKALGKDKLAEMYDTGESSYLTVEPR